MNSGLPVAFHNSTWVGNQTIKFLEKNKDEPFVLWTSFPDPHTPFNCPEPWCYMYNPDEIDLPENPERDFHRRPWWHKQSFEGKPNMPELCSSIFSIATKVFPVLVGPNRAIIFL